MKGKIGLNLEVNPLHRGDEGEKDPGFRSESSS